MPASPNIPPLGNRALDFLYLLEVVATKADEERYLYAIWKGSIQSMPYKVPQYKQLYPSQKRLIAEGYLVITKRYPSPDTNQVRALVAPTTKALKYLASQHKQLIRPWRDRLAYSCKRFAEQPKPESRSK